MNFKLNALVATLIMAAAGSAHAITTTNDVSGGNAYLFLTVLDADFNGGIGRSYTRSLEVAMNDFGTINRSTGGFTTNVDTLTSLKKTWATGALWSTFTAGMTTAQISGLKWDVTALDSAGTASPDKKRILTTASSDLVADFAADGTSTDNGEFNSATLNQDAYWDAAIALMGTGTEILVTDTASQAFAISAAVHSTNFSGQSPDFTTMNNVGASSGFYYLTRTGSSSTPEALVAGYGNIGGPSSFMLGTDGALVFMPTPVPEASTYGMMLAGLGLVGFMTRRRLNHA